MILGDISQNIISSGVTIAMEIKWPHGAIRSAGSFVESIDTARFTKRFPVRIVMRIFCGSFISSYRDFSLHSVECENRWMSDFFSEKRALSAPGKESGQHNAGDQDH